MCLVGRRDDYARALLRALGTLLVSSRFLPFVPKIGVGRPYHIYGNCVDIAIERDIVHISYVGRFGGQSIVGDRLRDITGIIRLELSDERVVATG